MQTRRIVPIRALLLCAALVVPAAGCGGEDEPVPTAPPAQPDQGDSPEAE